MRRIVILVWLGAIAVALFGPFIQHGPDRPSAAMFLLWLWLPVALTRWAMTRLKPTARHIWLGINVVVIISVAASMSREVLIVALTTINVIVWLGFVFGRSVFLHRLRRLRKLAESTAEPNGA